MMAAQFDADGTPLIECAQDVAEHAFVQAKADGCDCEIAVEVETIGPNAYEYVAFHDYWCQTIRSRN